MRFRILVVGTIVIVSSALASAMLTNGHDWGDDFAAYIMQASALVHGSIGDQIAHTSFTMRESSRAYAPRAVPWGFPALLAPAVLACGNLNILCLKIINIPLFAGFVLVFYVFLTRRLSFADSLIATCVMAFSPALLSFEDNVLSDLAFLFFSTASLLAIETVIVAPEKPEGSPAANVGMGVLFFLAYTVRANGILLIPTLLLTQVFIYSVRARRRRPSGVLLTGLLPYLAFGTLAIGLLAIVPPAESSYLSYFRALTPRIAAGNALAYLLLPLDFFEGMPFPLDILFYGVLLPCAIVGAVRRWKQEFHILTYIVLTLLLLIAWPFQDGLRYAFPLLPFLLGFGYCGMQGTVGAITRGDRRAMQMVVRAAWVAVGTVFLATSLIWGRVNLANRRATDDGPFEPRSEEMLDVIRTRTSPDNVVIFSKPRAMRLLTGRDAILIDRCDQLGRGDYAVIERRTDAGDQLRADSVATCNTGLNVSLVFENAEYLVYRIARK